MPLTATLLARPMIPCACRCARMSFSDYIQLNVRNNSYDRMYLWARSVGMGA
jgi:hypothetical protein